MPISKLCSRTQQKAKGNLKSINLEWRTFKCNCRRILIGFPFCKDILQLKEEFLEEGTYKKTLSTNPLIGWKCSTLFFLVKI